MPTLASDARAARHRGTRTASASTTSVHANDAPMHTCAPAPKGRYALRGCPGTLSSRSEEHKSELQSLRQLVWRPPPEKKKKQKTRTHTHDEQESPHETCRL